MLRRCAFQLLPALVISAIALSGCGGSSKKSTTSTTSTGSGSSRLSPTTPLKAPLAERLFREEGVTHGLTASQATRFVACLENKFASQGMKTFADASGNTSQTRLDSEDCALNVKTGG
jgi:hypothetical protein